MTVRKFLDLSTAHLTPATRANLDNDLVPHGPVFTHAKYGWFVWVPNNPEEADNNSDQWPADLSECIYYARGQDCDYILFDRDAAMLEELPVYDDDGSVIEPDAHTPGDMIMDAFPGAAGYKVPYV